MSTESSNLIQSIQRAVAIMRSFTEAEPELSVSELSRRLDLHKSTVSRMLSTLQHERLVEQNPETGHYRLGLGLISLAGVALGSFNARAAAQPYLKDLVTASQETINVTVLHGDECVNIERSFSPQPIRYMGWIGRRTPIHCTASGKVLLAYMDPAERDAILSRPLTRYTDATVTDLPDLLAQLDQIRQQGYAVVHEEYEKGFSSVAAPLTNHEGEVNATIAISGPTFRMGEAFMDAQIPLLLQVTRQISTDLGHRA